MAGARGSIRPGSRSIAGLTIVRFLSMAGGFLASVLGAQILGAEGMGVVGVGLTVGALAALLLSGGIGLSTVYFLSRRPDERPALVGRLLALGALAIAIDLVVVTAAAILLGPGTDAGGSALLWGAPLSATMLGFEVGGSLLLGLAAAGAFIAMQFVEAAVGLVAVAGVLLFVSPTPGGFLFATVVGYAVSVVVALVQVRRRVPNLRLGLDRAFAGEALRFGLRGQLGNIIGYLNARLDLLLVSQFVGLGAAGLYYVAVRLAEAVLLVAQAGATMLYPTVAAQADRTETRATERLVRAMILVVGAEALGVVILGEPFIRIAFGREFAAAVPAAQLVAVSMIPFAIHRLLGGDLRGRGHPGLVSASSAIALVAAVALDLVLIPAFGIVGAAVASLIAYSVSAVALVAFYLRVTGGSGLVLVPTFRDVQLLAREAIKLVRALPGSSRRPGGRSEAASPGREAPRRSPTGSEPPAP